MRPLLALATGMTLLVLQGCPTYQLNQVPASAPLAHPVPIAADSSFVHAPSKYAFPQSMAGFERVALMQYDTKGLDVSAGYDGGGRECPVSLTVYVSPTPRMSFFGADPAVVRSLEAQWLGAAYAHWKREIVQAHPAAVLVSESERTQDGAPGRKAVYAFDDRESDLFVFVIDRAWYLTYRQTFPAACSSQAKSLLQAFFAKWQGRVG